MQATTATPRRDAPSRASRLHVAADRSGVRWRRLLDEILPLQERLERHPLYDRLRTLADVRTFMEHHVFAVWDFMTLVKALQRELTGSAHPWRPIGEPRVRRFVNEVVLAEESDLLPDGRVASHFELYVEAMDAAGAERSSIDAFLRALHEGRHADDALAGAGAPPAAREFGARTLATVARGRLPEIAAAFALGRERMIPPVFDELVAGLSASSGEPRAAQGGTDRLSALRLYLERHIEIDGEEHGPAAQRLLEAICRDDDDAWREATSASLEALRARERLWDAVVEAIDTRQRSDALPR